MLANELDAKRDLLDIVASLMDARLDARLTGGVDARGGTLLIDEAHNLHPEKTPNGRVVLQYLLTIAEDNKDHITLILTGYERDIAEKLLSEDPGLPSRFPTTVAFEDFSAVRVGEAMCREGGPHGCDYAPPSPAHFLPPLAPSP